jgi:hypothetical protein
MVKAACIASAETLGPQDLVGVLAVGPDSEPVLGFTEIRQLAQLRRCVLPLPSLEGRRLEPALVEGLRMFMLDSRAKSFDVKHVILVSDGDAPAADPEIVVRRLVDAGITASTVCVGGGNCDPLLMSQIAAWGKGHFYFTSSVEKVTQLILNDAQMVLATIPKGG